MNPPLSSSTDLKMRKDLVRLRMEMHRQQLRYHARPLASPLHYVQGLFGRDREPDETRHPGKSPMIAVATALLFLFGKRLGRFGTLARIGITLYPIIKGQQILRRKIKAP
ncbi:hypothetical protein [Pseudomonas oligotrophica]|uniref:hypothetical protein n=1 Tax=Pseudomonas oligotrophica TaxID=2912055 RepID=UPI001F19E653|nr:hypothetical protein [Pseudomonas oligotrophica]MCF7202996.1 hypothetical protein [Pseudomonas oligotrophica]